MVFFTIFATIDSITLLAAMTGLVGVTLGKLKGIADLEYDIVNSTEFFAGCKLMQKVELALIVVNIVACAPFMTNWWMAPPQVVVAGLLVLRHGLGWSKIDEKDVFKKDVYLHHRTVHTFTLFFFLVSWFIYFARAVTAVMDIHVHGISPYD
mmetsp:Transcript_66925/g.131763  ORF Transcript_66925/g.131763 Transcript_66925/m.131763 type:complete len:152 (+) Transcript_66925:72-527(+)